MKAGSVDFGHTGDSPPIFAQAAGVPLVYVAASTSCPEASAIVVRVDSPIRTLADLRGKKVAFTRGSSAHTMILRALASADLSIHDIESVYLSPADARAAFETGGVDAWSIWDPYLALVEHEGRGRAIASGEGLVPGREFYFASSNFLSQHRGLIAILIRELNGLKNWAAENPEETSKLLAAQIGMAPKVLERAETRPGRYGIETNKTAIATEQQKLADTFFQLELLPHELDVESIIDLVEPATVEPSAK